MPVAGFQPLWGTPARRRTMTLELTAALVVSSRWPCGGWCVVETHAVADRYLTSLTRFAHGGADRPPGA